MKLNNIKFDIIKILDIIVWIPILGLIIFVIARIFLILAKDNKKMLMYWTIYQLIIYTLIMAIITFYYYPLELIQE